MHFPVGIDMLRYVPIAMDGASRAVGCPVKRIVVFALIGLVSWSTVAAGQNFDDAPMVTRSLDEPDAAPVDTPLTAVDETAVDEEATAGSDAEAVVDDNELTNTQRPFLFPTLPVDIAETFATFQRDSRRGVWDQAFKSLKKFKQADADRLIAEKPSNRAEGDAIGFLMPLSARIRKTLIDLPPEGRAAYRVFFDAKAKQLLDQTTSDKLSNIAEVRLLSEIYTSYFITSYGDVAADRLGDLHFQRGNLGQAARCWQSILDHHPESRLSAARLQLKRGIALVRGGRLDDAAEVLRVLNQRYASETVKLGGRGLNARDHLAELIAQHRQPNSANRNRRITRTPGLPSSNTPLWTIPFFETTKDDKPPKGKASDGHLHAQHVGLDEVPPLAIYEDRCYVAIGKKFLAIDLMTGKSLWPKKRVPVKPKQPFRKLLSDFFDGESYDSSEAVSSPDQIAAFDRIVCHTRQKPGTDGQMRLVCLDALSGEVLWSSDKIKNLRGWSFLGKPVLGSGRLMVAGTRHDKPSDLEILSIRPTDGKLVRTTRLGMRQTQESYSGITNLPTPSLVVDRDKLLVDTHAGGLAQISCETGSIDWGFSYPAVMPKNSWRFGWGETQNSPEAHNTAPLVQGDIAYLKPASSSTVYAIDLNGPSILWRREVDPLTDGLIQLDHRPFRADGKSYEASMLIAGTQYNLYGLDTSTGTPQWDLISHNRNVPPAQASLPPIVEGDHIYRFTNLGVYVLDKTDHLNRAVPTGFEGNDPEEIGGHVLIRKGTMITISNRAMTAYRLPAKNNNASADKSKQTTP